MGLNERNLCKFECFPLFTVEFKSVDAFSIGIQIPVKPIYAPIASPSLATGQQLLFSNQTLDTNSSFKIQDLESKI